MKNGTYRYTIEMLAPIGPRSGRMELTLTDGRAEGMLTLFQQTTPVQKGICRGNRIHFTGEMKTLLYALPYTADGMIGSRSFELTFLTEKGSFPVSGRKEPVRKSRKTAAGRKETNR